jgi:hypothetical protein
MSTSYFDPQHGCSGSTKQQLVPCTINGATYLEQNVDSKQTNKLNTNDLTNLKGAAVSLGQSGVMMHQESSKSEAYLNHHPEKREKMKMKEMPQ